MQMCHKGNLKKIIFDLDQNVKIAVGYWPIGFPFTLLHPLHLLLFFLPQSARTLLVLIIKVREAAKKKPFFLGDLSQMWENRPF